MRIYWSINGKRCGPATVPDVLAKIELGELTPNTLGWHSGCDGWSPLRELPALADFLRGEEEQQHEQHEQQQQEPASEPPPAEAAEPASPPPAEQPRPAPRLTLQQLPSILPGPLPRLMARLVDMGLYATLALYILHVCQAPYRIYFLPSNPLFWVPMPLLEALLLYKFKTTPGKQWMGIRMTNIQGAWSYGKLAMRGYLVILLGLGCMIMPVCLITMAFSCYLLTKRGITLWDLRCTTLPICLRRPTAFSIVATACFLFICLQLCGQCMLPWMPDIINYIRPISPEWADTIEETLRNATPQG